MAKIIEKRSDNIVIYELESDTLSVRVMNFGAHLISVKAPDREGRMADVVLGYEDPADYFTGHGKLGAVVGRVANRIKGASFTLNGKEYSLEANDGANHIHGGSEGFDKKFFGHEIVENGVRFSYTSPDGEAGYPGELDLTVTYTLEDNTLSIIYEAECDKDTILNLTNHAYFNLSGGSEKIYDHEFRCESDFVAESSDEKIPTGVFLDVEGTPFDFRDYRRIGERIDDDNAMLKGAGGYDHAMMLREGGRAFLRHTASGRTLTVETDMPAIQIYTGNYLGGSEKGLSGKPYEKGDGVALETEFLPDSVHVEKEPRVILRRGKKFRSVTRLVFGC